VDYSAFRPARLTLVFNLHDAELPEELPCSPIFGLCTAVYLLAHLYSIYAAYQGFSQHTCDAMCLYSCFGQLLASSASSLLLDSHDIEVVSGYLSAVELLVVLLRKNLPKNSQAYNSKSRRLFLSICCVSVCYAAGFAVAERIVFDRHLPIDASLGSFFSTSIKTLQALAVFSQVAQTAANAQVHQIDVIGVWCRLFAVWIYAAVLCLRGLAQVCRWQVFVRDGLLSGVLLLQFYWLHRHGSKYK